MTRQQSDGELHVEAMRLMIEAHERREDPPDWTVWRHMLWLLATIFRGIEDQRRDDQDELMHTRKHCDHWKQARQEAIEAGELMQAEIKVLRQQLDESQARRVVIADEAANDKLQKIAIHCELQAAQGEITSLRQQLRGAHAPAMAQQGEEIAYLRARLDEERSVIASLRQQLESALALLTGQRLNAEEQDREIERLRKFADEVRTQVTRYAMSWASWNEIKSALAELDAQPAPVAETAEGGT